MARIFRGLCTIKRYVNVPTHGNQLQRHFRTSKARCNTKLKPQSEAAEWHIYSSVCLERLPVISQEMDHLERQFQETLWDIEFEHSKLSDHELRHKEDLHLAELRKSEDFEESTEEVVRISALEDEDKWHHDAKSVSPAPRITAADQHDNRQSVERKLDQRLLLMIEQKLGDQNVWTLPMGIWQKNENMRQSAERILREMCGTNIKATFLGNAPCGFYQYHYPQAVQQDLGIAGGKVFFFKAVFNKGQIVKHIDVSDYMWLTKDEMKKQTDRRYFRVVNRFVLD